MDFIAFASVVLEKDGKFLIVQEGKEANYGLWNFPGGHLDIEEHLVDAAIREAREEVLCDVKVESLLGVFIDVKKFHAFHFIFKGKILSGTPAPGDMIINCKWVTALEMKMIPEVESLNYWKFQKVAKMLEEDINYPLDVIAERNW